jgi:hypothetical protein
MSGLPTDDCLPLGASSCQQASLLLPRCGELGRPVAKRKAQRPDKAGGLSVARKLGDIGRGPK